MNEQIEKKYLIEENGRVYLPHYYELEFEIARRLKEIQDYITSDGSAADKMTQDIAANKKAIEDEVVAREDAVTTLEGKIADAEAAAKSAATKIVETVKRTGGSVSGPVPLPTKVQKYTILRAVHKYKDSREQFEIRTHKRLIDINNPSKETIDALSHLDLPSGVDIQIKY